MFRTTIARLICGAALLAVAACGSSTPLSTSALIDPSPALVRPGDVHVDQSLDAATARHLVRTAQELYTFWNTGEESHLDAAVDASFRDHTLPPGRPQGPAGPVAASQQFRAAVPDLTCDLQDLYVVDDTFTARLVFRGHFTGTYNDVAGQGQPIEFTAIDIQHLGDGARITEDWHLEDNLTFLQQAGLVTVAGADG